MPRFRPLRAARRTEALLALLAPVLPLALVLLGATPVLPAVADWLLVLPALLAALLLFGQRRRQRVSSGIKTVIKTRTAHGLLD